LASCCQSGPASRPRSALWIMRVCVGRARTVRNA
jgi:hypothetical protein